MFGSTADQVKAGKLFGTFVQYGYDTAPVTGGTLQYAEGKAFNPIVPGRRRQGARRHGGAIQERRAEDRADRERRAQRQLIASAFRSRAAPASSRKRRPITRRIVAESHAMTALLRNARDRALLRRGARQRRRRSRRACAARSSVCSARTAPARAPDEGAVRHDPARFRRRSCFAADGLAGHRPADAMAAGVAMIHQHFMLIEAMTRGRERHARLARGGAVAEASRDGGARARGEPTLRPRPRSRRASSPTCRSAAGSASKF